MESAAIAGLAFATLAGAWFFQYVLHVLPCHLCLMQRWAYYFVIPTGALVAVAAFHGMPRKALGAVLVLVALALLANSAFGGYHAGVEWGFWKGPSDCTGTIPDLGSLKGGLLAQIDKAEVVPCDKVQWRLFGVSLAGFNAMISAFLAYFAWNEAIRCLRKETTR
jgi:disulfide bond formation protein DsbB